MPDVVNLGGVKVGEAALEQPGGGAPILVGCGGYPGSQKGLAISDGFLHVGVEGAVGTGPGGPALLQPVIQGIFGDTTLSGGGAETTTGGPKGCQDSADPVRGELGGAGHLFDPMDQGIAQRQMVW